MHGPLKWCKFCVCFETVVVEKISFCKHFSFWGKWENFLRKRLSGSWTYFCCYSLTALLETARWVCRECWSLNSVLLCQSCWQQAVLEPGPWVFQITLFRAGSPKDSGLKASCALCSMAGGLNARPGSRPTAEGLQDIHSSLDAAEWLQLSEEPGALLDGLKHRGNPRHPLFWRGLL